jgi:hypothetical protein
MNETITEATPAPAGVVCTLGRWTLGVSAGDPRPNPPALAKVWVAGAAKTKGSLSAQVAPGVTASGRRRVRMVESVVGSGAWRAATVQAVMAALGGAPSPDGPRLPLRPPVPAGAGVL